MVAIARRGLSPEFLADLQGGLLAPIRERVARDQSLCLELREDYVNVYYRGGNVMRVSRANGGYSAFFDTKYFRGVVPSMPGARLGEASDVAAWLAALPTLKQAMDLAQPGEERDVQQLILRDNNLGCIARSTDYYVCDIEYANHHGRFDLVAVRWPSTPTARKKQDGHRLVLGEVKVGDGALEGTAGLHAHVDDVNGYLAAPGNLAAIKEEMLRVFNQKRALGLVDCEKDLTGFSDEPPVLLLVLVNHDPDKSRLRELLRTLPPSPHAELRIATGSLLGYGLYDPAILTHDRRGTRALRGLHLMATGPVLTIHRAADEIGGNCIELEHDGHRLLLDAGSPLVGDGITEPQGAIPRTLDTSKDIAGLVISHPHQDHWGLLRSLPASWSVWSGAASETLIRMTASLSGGGVAQRFQTYRPHEPFSVGPFTITPFLTDHSAFDAHMLLVDVGGKRVLYSGDFRRVGRKAALVDRLMKDPPPGVDVLLLEGTTLGRAEAFPTEAALEDDFVSLFQRTPGRVFITWSAQNIDRTVTIYRACKKAGRTLVLDLYTIDVMERLSALRDTLPRLGWPQVRAVITSSMKWMYESPDRMNAPAFVERVATSGHAMGAAKLAEMRDAVVMLRSSLLRDFGKKGVEPTADDAWVFSMWSGYLKTPEYQQVRAAFEAAGATFAQIHTSGHASRDDLEEFARSIAPRRLVPIHSFTWDEHLDGFENVQRLRDGEPFTIP